MTVKKVVANTDLVAYIKAGYPLLQIITAEEGRAEFEIAKVAQECNRRIYVWSATEGLYDLQTKNFDKIQEPNKILEIINDKEGAAIFIMRDMHAFYKNPIVVRKLRDISRDFKQKKKAVILLSPIPQLPPDLERDVVVIDFELPTKEQLAENWDNLYGSHKTIFEQKKAEISEEERDRILTAAAGLTQVEAENAFSKSIVISLGSVNDENRPIISELVMKEKAQAVKKNGILEYFEAIENASSIGGLDQLKLWLDRRSRAFTKEAREFGLPAPKGILLIGLPGCGKSLTAKAASNMLKVPLIRFDISRVFGGIVGQSEQQMRSALQTIDRVGQCVVWIDEAEKAFAGASSSGGHDSGVTKRVFGNFLTYMQEKQGGAFVVMTVNDIGSIQSGAPEMLRKGRFDEIFFVGLPSKKERRAIFEIHIKRYARDPKQFDLNKLANITQHFSGAEIEQSIIEGLYLAFYENEELNDKYIIKACNTTNPLAKSSKEALNNMKEWATHNAVNASINGESEDHAGRTLDIA